MQERFQASSAEKLEQLILPWCQLKIISAPSKKENKKKNTLQISEDGWHFVLFLYHMQPADGGEQMLARLQCQSEALQEMKSFQSSLKY